MQKIVEKLIDNIYLIILLVGSFFILIGVTKGISTTTFSMVVDELEWRIIIVILGIFFVLISFQILYSSKITERNIKHNLKPSSNAFGKWNEIDFSSRLENSKEICMISTSNYDMLTGSISENLKDFLRNGGKYRCVYLDPESDSLSLVAERNIDVEKDLDHLKVQYKMTIEALKNLKIISKKENALQIRLTNNHSGYVLTILDTKTPSAVAYVTLNGYGKHYTSRPSLTLHKKDDEESFAFFEDTFENLWDKSENNKVDLTS